MEQHSATLVTATPNAEEQIVYMARVSNPSSQAVGKNNSRLIKYLIKHNHWSPFEMCTVQLEITTTRAIAAQILRHRSFSFQEFSQRYSDVRQLPVIGLPRLRRQDGKNRQSSHDDIPVPTQLALHATINELHDHIARVYGQLLDAGVAKECARAVLPMGVPTKLYMSGTVRSWIHYIELRADASTQYEHRTIALQARKILSKLLPSVADALGW